MADLHSQPHVRKTINVEQGILAKTPPHHHLPSEPITAARSTEANVTLSGSARCGPEVLSSTTVDYTDKGFLKYKTYKRARELNTKQQKRKLRTSLFAKAGKNTHKPLRAQASRKPCFISCFLCQQRTIDLFLHSSDRWSVMCTTTCCREHLSFSSGWEQQQISQKHNMPLIQQLIGKQLKALCKKQAVRYSRLSTNIASLYI